MSHTEHTTSDPWDVAMGPNPSPLRRLAADQLRRGVDETGAPMPSIASPAVQDPIGIAHQAARDGQAAGSDLIIPWWLLESPLPTTLVSALRETAVRAPGRFVAIVHQRVISQDASAVYVAVLDTNTPREARPHELILTYRQLLGVQNLAHWDDIYRETTGRHLIEQGWMPSSSTAAGRWERCAMGDTLEVTPIGGIRSLDGIRSTDPC